MTGACNAAASPSPTQNPPTAAATEQPTVAPTEVPFPTGPVSLTMWVTADGATKASFEGFFKDYQKIHPNVSLTVEEYPFTDLHDKLSVAIQAGTGAPDLALPEISRFALLLKGSQVGLVDLTDRIAAAKMDLVPSLQNNYTYQGHVYGIQTDVNPVQLYYRKDLFEKAAITTPIATWADYIAAGHTLKDKAGASIMAIETTDYDVWTPIMLQYGCNFFDTSGKVVLDSDACRKAFRFLVSLVRDEKIAIPAPGGDQYNPTFWGAYGKGDVAAIWGASWMLSLLEGFIPDQKGKWAAQALPNAAPDAPWDTSTVGGNALVITNQSKNVDVSWDFIRWLLLEKPLPDVVYAVPNNKARWNDAVFQKPSDYLGGQVIGQLWLQQTQTLLQDGAPYLNPDPNNTTAYDVFTRTALGPAINGDSTADTALDAAVAELKAAVGQ
ncbi:MAG TPA: sugar ABC transporter substrate-binding protein [Patescibacteria group bacterium]|nr:sugar ABC transporter substrate-binding protein [Patescibacteria group bacterium]